MVQNAFVLTAPDVSARTQLLERVLDAARSDERVVGVVDYGSNSEGRADAWSDLDLAIFVRDADCYAFLRDWKAWAAQFGELLLAYVGRVGHPWAVYRRGRVPLRVDFDVIAASRAATVAEWQNSPTSVEAMVLYDAGGGELTSAVRTIVGKSLRPADSRASFEAECGDFWYFALLVYCKLQRGEHWVARQVFHNEVLDHLLRLLRLEAGGAALEHWRWKQHGFGVERTLSRERLTQLDHCVPASGPDGLRAALTPTVVLAAEACVAIAAREGWPWPEELAAELTALVAS